MGFRFPGSHLFMCDRCNFQYSSDKKRKMWNGLVVCVYCYDTRHPSDFHKAIREDTSVPDPRPIGPIVFTDGYQYPIFTLTDENGTPILTEDGDYIQVPLGVIS